ncbi:hypothetical protein OKA05_25310 [Luteolibacter arcticus]|uniref:DUF1877 family protein n=1 Tax=Luteolibacter arcticus TaxID=1581411 RepID=A0ABT3GQV4_9BACT|nr:hypothetical protein [Luteolibacter arcticus]MCW1925903.1 hypothetical protein [Luteolibacter arcticus]
MGADLIWQRVHWAKTQKAAEKGNLHAKFFDEDADETGEAFEAEEVELDDAVSWLGAWYPWMELTESIAKSGLPRSADFERQAALLRELGILWGTSWEEEDILKGATGARKDVALPVGEDVEPPFIAAYAPETLSELAERVRAEDWGHFTRQLDAVRAAMDDASDLRPSSEEITELLDALPEFLESLGEEGRGVLTWLSF